MSKFIRIARKGDIKEGILYDIKVIPGYETQVIIFIEQEIVQCTINKFNARYTIISK